MAKEKPAPGISARLVTLLEGVRPSDEETGKALSDNKWCEAAGVNSGFWRDLRGGSVPSIDNVERMARAAGLKLSDLIDGAERPVNPLPSAAELEQMVSDAQGELVPGTTLSDYPRFVGPALLTRLERYVYDRRSNSSAREPAPDRVAPTRAPTKRGAAA